MTKKTYLSLVTALEEAGYADEIQWQRELQPCTDPVNFLMETCWVILNGGMKEQVARIIWDRIKEAWSKNIDIATMFGHQGKVASIKYMAKNYEREFKQYLDTDDKLEFLESLPHIGPITKYHLAKNLGLDYVKPDRHLIRIADQYNTSPDLLCQKLSDETGEKKSVIDIVIWRACNLQLI